MNNIIEASGITKNYKQPNGEALPVLRGIDLEVHAGEMVAVMGPSGCGKSTLLHILGLMAKADGGVLNILGRPVQAMEVAGQNFMRRCHIGFLFQFDSLLEELTVRENLRLRARMKTNDGRGERPFDFAQGVPSGVEGRSRIHDDAIEAWAAKLNIAGKLDAYPRGLSVGECCRANLLKALIGKPKVVFADEPTGNLDAKNAKKLAQEFLEIVSGLESGNSAAPAIILATHNHEIASQANRILLLEDGKLRETKN
ncbi:MAG: ATP-binding cassette domain-containing protein [Elusimicrobia bacterium]|nr:ATP-binding cassette domain-containing protein [Elusimicrobiota bacterium]